MIDTSPITYPEAKRFITVFLTYRAINRKFYELVPEEKFDYRMVDTSSKKSDSVRENLAHQINVERAYLLGVQEGKLTFGKRRYIPFGEKSKKELLILLDEQDQELVDFLSREDNLNRKVEVKWSPVPIPAISALWSLNDHEILHNGINIAITDHLNIPRFPELKRTWG